MFFGTQLDLILVFFIVIAGRTIDMCLASLRTVFTVKDKPQIAAPIGFVEAFFWFMIVKAALDYAISNPIVDTIVLAIAYSLGFALGTMLGGILSRKFIKSKIHVQIVLSSKNDDIIKEIKEKGFGQTILTAKGANSNTETYMIFVETDSHKLKDLRTIINTKDEKAFVSVSESKSVFNGFFGTSTRK
ncbi:MAG: DUF2179 domain-containing protein [Anaeroplasmataceae bacterium]|nr:DUF2179 domain-containing protein [Anaeroplasmataceae bacterium]